MTYIAIGLTLAGNILMKIVTPLGILTTWVLFYRNNQIKTSEFYLSKVEEHYGKAVFNISPTNNNCIKWHQAIEHLKIAESFIPYIKCTPQKNALIGATKITGFQFIEAIEQIKDFRFFYGVQNYSNKDSSELFNESSYTSLDKPALRISPEALNCLCVFIDKVNRVFFDTENDESYIKIFNSKYFRASIKNQISHLGSLATQVIQEYIEDYNEHKTKRLLKVVTLRKNQMRPPLPRTELRNIWYKNVPIKIKKLINRQFSSFYNSL